MPSLETLSEADLRGPLKTTSMRRARGYVRRVQDPARDDQTLTARVRGSRLYQVEVEVGTGGIHAVCSCVCLELKHRAFLKVNLLDILG